MAKAYIGTNSYKLMLGNTKIRRAYLGNVLVYSGDITVTYHITNDNVYVETVEEGQNCLQPKSFNPQLSRRGYENKFLGWRLDAESSSEVLETLVAGSDNIDLYAVYYREYIVNFYNGSINPTTYTYRSYINNETPMLYPKTGTEETTLVDINGYTNKLGWTDVIWNNQTRNFSQKYGNGTQIEIKQDINLYSVYNTNVTMAIINGKNSGTEKSYVAGVRSRQYTPTVNTYNPLLNLKHNDVSGWQNGGWSFNGSAEKSLDDGDGILITKSFDDDIKTINALYTKDITVYTINGDNKKVTNNLRVTRICKDTGIVIAPAKLTLAHTTVSGWDNYGWNITADSVSKVYEDGIVELDETFNGKTLYALYRKTIKFAVYNGGNKKTSYTKYIYIQYNTTSTRYTEADKITLKHSTVTNYTSYGWNMTKNNVTKKYDDGEISVKSDFNGQELYALYSKKFTLSVINGNLNKTDNSLTRYLQYNGELYTLNPTINLTHTSIADLTVNGWNLGADNQTAIITADGNTAIIELYDNKTLYALYRRAVRITFYTTSTNTTVKTGTQYYRAIVSNWAITYPTAKLAVPELSGWTALGWIRTKSAAVPDWTSNSEILITANNMIVYSIYRQNITLTVESKGVVTDKYDGVKYRYYNRPLGIYNNPKFTVPDPAAVSDKIFRGWATAKGSTTVAYDHFTNIALEQNTYIGALWKQNDYVVYDYGNNYKSYYSTQYPYTGAQFGSKLTVINLDSIDTNWYDKASITMQAFLDSAQWVVASWAYCAIFPGTVPSGVKYNGQPTNVLARGINIWEAGGWHINSDIGPCANNQKATITVDLTATANQGSVSKLSIAFIEDYYASSSTYFNLFKLVRLGKTRVW